MLLQTLSKCLLNTDRLGESTASLGSLFQCLTTLLVKKCFLTSSLNLPWRSFEPFPRFALNPLIRIPTNAKTQISSLVIALFAFDFTLGSPFYCLVPVHWSEKPRKCVWSLTKRNTLPFGHYSREQTLLKCATSHRKHPLTALCTRPQANLSPVCFSDLQIKPGVCIWVPACRLTNHVWAPEQNGGCTILHIGPDS